MAPTKVELVRNGTVRAAEIVTQIGDLTDAIDACQTFDRRADGWHMVALDPAGVA